MNVIMIETSKIKGADWNPNRIDAPTRARLAVSLGRWGLRLPLLVRTIDDGEYECVGGSMRLDVLREQGQGEVPCLLADDLDDAEVKLLSMALNRIGGSDDISAKAQLVKTLLDTMPAEEVAKVLPDTAEALQGLAALGQPGASDLAQQLSTWAATEAVKAEAKLHVTSFPFSDEQAAVIEGAVVKALPAVARYEGPNKRAAALVHIAQEWASGRGYRPSRGGHLRVVSAAATPYSNKEE